MHRTILFDCRPVLQSPLHKFREFLRLDRQKDGNGSGIRPIDVMAAPRLFCAVRHLKQHTAWNAQARLCIRLDPDDKLSTHSIFDLATRFKVPAFADIENVRVVPNPNARGHLYMFPAEW